MEKEYYEIVLKIEKETYKAIRNALFCKHICGNLGNIIDEAAMCTIMSSIEKKHPLCVIQKKEKTDE